MSKQQAINLKLTELRLPSSYQFHVDQWFSPIVDTLSAQLSAPNRGAANTPMILGIQGSQGSGKSTSAEFLKLLLEYEKNLSSVILSMDDFYLTRQERQQLANKKHPLLITRGVPGTHDINLALDTIHKLKNLQAKQTVYIPRFDKAIDDRLPIKQWEPVVGSVDVIILEGWCVGLSAQTQDLLAQPVNALEAEEDPDGTWRSYVNHCLATDYRELFSLIDKLLVLSAPCFDNVYQWRLKQEQKLIASLTDKSAQTKTLLPEQLKRFVAHYQRLTEHALKTLPAKADWCLVLGENQEILEMQKMIKDNVAPPPFIVVTDLDGTLLDHHSYSCEAATPALEKLRALNIPVIFNTSKTVKEVIALQQKLSISAPFIVENGSALYIPKHISKALFAQEKKIPQLFNSSLTEEYYYLLFGEHRKKIIDIIHTERKQHQWPFSGYADWSVEEVMLHTGLSVRAAEQSLDRQYSEPFLWQGTEAAYQDFKRVIKKNHLEILQGGRFYHVIGQTNKAKPIKYLKSTLYKSPETKVICLGDSANDIDMLEAADYPVCIRSPVGEYPKLSRKKTYFTRKFGPEGWNEAIEKILNENF